MFCNGSKGGNFVFHKRGFLVISRRKSTLSRSGMKTVKRSGNVVNLLGFKSINCKRFDLAVLVSCFHSCIVSVKMRIYLFNRLFKQGPYEFRL